MLRPTPLNEASVSVHVRRPSSTRGRKGGSWVIRVEGGEIGDRDRMILIVIVVSVSLVSAISSSAAPSSLRHLRCHLVTSSLKICSRRHF